MERIQKYWEKLQKKLNSSQQTLEEGRRVPTNPASCPTFGPESVPDICIRTQAAKCDVSARSAKGWMTRQAVQTMFLEQQWATHWMPNWQCFLTVRLAALVVALAATVPDFLKPISISIQNKTQIYLQKFLPLLIDVLAQPLAHLLKKFSFFRVHPQIIKF